MRRMIFVLGIILIFTSVATAQENPAQENQAQENPAYARLLATPYFMLAPLDGETASTAPLGIAPATPATSAFASVTLAPAANASSSSPAAGSPQGVQSVFVNYQWQAYAGYTFDRFYVVPGKELNTNGFNLSMQYYFLNWFGLDGEFAGTITTQRGVYNGWLVFGGGGPRFRWLGPRGIELWGHVLVGYSHFTPQTPFGSQDAFAYTAGGGGDINIRRTRFALRLGADMVATHYFGTYQYSPKAFGGIVFKF